MQNCPSPGKSLCYLQESSSQAKARLNNFLNKDNLNKMAVRIAGVNLPDNKRIEIALTYIYGIGRSRSNEILKKVGLDKDIRTKDLKIEDVNRLREEIEKNYRLEGELKREVMMNIKRLKEIGCYRGIRHIRGLPVRGQRTKTNTRTVRGNKRVTMGSGKRTVEKK